MFQGGKQFMQKIAVKTVTNEDLIKYLKKGGEVLALGQT